MPSSFALPIAIPVCQSQKHQQRCKDTYSLSVNNGTLHTLHTLHTLQMMYWAVETLQLAEAAEPLAPFVHELARSGESTASCMYGKSG